MKADQMTLQDLQRRDPAVDFPQVTFADHFRCTAFELLPPSVFEELTWRAWKRFTGATTGRIPQPPAEWSTDPTAQPQGRDITAAGAGGRVSYGPAFPVERRFP